VNLVTRVWIRWGDRTHNRSFVSVFGRFDRRRKLQIGNRNRCCRHLRPAEYRLRAQDMLYLCTFWGASQAADVMNPITHFAPVNRSLRMRSNLRRRVGPGRARSGRARGDVLGTMAPDCLAGELSMICHLRWHAVRAIHRRCRKRNSRNSLSRFGAVRVTGNVSRPAAVTIAPYPEKNRWRTGTIVLRSGLLRRFYVLLGIEIAIVHDFVGHYAQLRPATAALWEC
jgi:hypothetical protein